MAPRAKRLIGLFILVPALCAYLFAAAAVGEHVPSFWLLQVIYYIVAGIAWAAPAIALMKWIERPDKR